ncbi:MAG TPA: lysophospholipid acyltransferase family protein [Anaeromyxobacteraceae bacterium]|nr:lysophospholipid acyltransferase family protein [Anaeromyxobacteraceae bacterium]
MIYGLRSFAWLFCLTVWHALKVTVAALAGVRDRPGGFYDRELRTWAGRLLQVTNLPVETRGLERVPPAACVYAVNHASFVDVWVLVAKLPGSVRFVAKRELYFVPIFGWALRATGQIALDRRDREAAARSYRAAAEAVRGGRSVIVFVEGTRTRSGRLGEFKKGAFVLAIEAGAPVVPVYLRGTRAAMPRGSLWLRRRPVTLVAGEPVPTAGLTYDDRDALRARVREWFLAEERAVDGARGAA